MKECEYCGEEFENDTELHAHWQEHSDELNSHQKDKMKKAKRKLKEQQDAKMQKRKQYAGYAFAGILGLVLVGVVGAQLLQSNGGSAQFGDLSGQPMLGNESAPVTIVEFGDYYCPYCREFETGERTGQDIPSNKGVFEKVKENFIDSGQVKFYFIHFPFLRPGSTDAAVAAECVYEQDNEQFWDYHHAIYKNQGSESERWATPDFLMEIARNSTEGLDYDQLRTCIDNQETLSEVRSDRQVGQQAGVSSTPSVFVNGERVSNWQYSNLAQEIESELN
jgi:protein-disulfide isomerase